MQPAPSSTATRFHGPVTRTAGARRYAAILGALALAASLSAPSTAIATVPSCAEGIVTLGPPTAPAGRVSLCTPELNAALALLVRQQAGMTDRLRDLERLVQTVAQMANTAQLDNASKVRELASNLARQIEQSSQSSAAASSRAVRDLTLKVEELTEKLEDRRGDARTKDAATAIGDSIGKAIVALDFGTASRLIDSLEGIQRQLSGVDAAVGRIEKQVDSMTATADETRLMTIVSEATSVRPTHDNGQVNAIGALVKMGRGFSGHDFDALYLAGLQAPRMRAQDATFFLARLDDADLREADLQRAGFVAASLNGLNAREARLPLARFAFASVRDANFVGADLTRTTWVGANLRGATLSEARLVNATLQHADLRDANLEKADLSGAYLGSADLRGARLAGAVFNNTDVFGAVLDTSQLTDAQRRGLCATPAGAVQRWEVVETRKSTQFASGLEFTTLFERQVLLSKTGQFPYPPCQPPSDDGFNSWNPPLIRYNRHLYHGEIRFRVPGELLDRPGRRRTFRDRLQEAQQRTEATIPLVITMPPIAPYVTEIAQRINQRQQSLPRKPAAPLGLDRDSAILLALRLRPGVLDAMGLDWKQVALEAGFSDQLGQRPQRDENPWPRFYPENVTAGYLSERALGEFRQWTLARSQALPSTEVWAPVRDDRPTASPTRIASQTLADILLRGQSASQKQAAAEFARRFQVAPEQVAAFRHSLHPIKLLGEPIWEVFLLTTPVSTLAIEPGSQTPRRTAMVGFKVTDVAYVPVNAPSLGSRHALVWTIAGTH